MARDGERMESSKKACVWCNGHKGVGDWTQRRSLELKLKLLSALDIIRC